MKKILIALSILSVVLFLTTGCENKTTNTESQNENNEINIEENEKKYKLNSKEYENNSDLRNIFSKLSGVSKLDGDTILSKNEIEQKYDFSELGKIEYQVRAKVLDEGYAEIALIKLENVSQNVEAFNVAAKRKQKLQDENGGFNEKLYQVEQKDGILFICYAPNSIEILEAFEDYMGKK